MTGLGTAINAGAILLGGIIGLMVKKQLSTDAQNNIKAVLVIFTFIAAAHMIWSGVGGTFWQIAKQVGIMFLSLILGNIIGMILGIQKRLAKLGEYATERFTKAQKGEKQPVTEGFITCTLLFCVGPMAILGSIQDGLTGEFKTLALKGALDGLATLSFAAVFGWSVMLAVIPVIAYQGTLTLLAKLLAEHLDQSMINSLNATGGLLVLCLPLVIYGVRTVPLANYLPALAVAPLLTKWLG
ncbi:MAG TPA: DUF554 domain-containing protein [Verrucomicrobiae bacterium]